MDCEIASYYQTISGPIRQAGLTRPADFQKNAAARQTSAFFVATPVRLKIAGEYHSKIEAHSYRQCHLARLVVLSGRNRFHRAPRSTLENVTTETFESSNIPRPPQFSSKCRWCRSNLHLRRPTSGIVFSGQSLTNLHPTNRVRLACMAVFRPVHFRRSIQYQLPILMASRHRPTAS